MAGSGEDALIARFFRPLASHPAALGLDDDAALLSVASGRELVITKDAIVSGVHFFSDDPPETIARKALRVNLSDLAAKGAEPAGYLLALALSDAIDDGWLEAFASGLGADAQTYGCPLLGGDTVRSPGPLMASVTAIGTLPAGTMVRRSGARAGDRVVVTGTIGDAALGLMLRRESEKLSHLDETSRAYLLSRYRLPQPRNAIAAVLRKHATAAMDVSDGLAGDLVKLCRASGVSAACEIGRAPLSDAARAALAIEPSLMEIILTGGDDYEIIAAIPPEQFESYRQACAACKISVTDVGEFVAGVKPPLFIDALRRPVAFEHASYSHF